jgi:sarcosine oxidase subunit gamma
MIRKERNWMAETIPRRHKPAARGGASDPHLAWIEPMTRLSLRLPDDAPALTSAILGLTLPVEPCRAAQGDHYSALWLGPAEWLILAAMEAKGLMAELSEETGQAPHSLVDISHRQTGIAVSGADAAAMLNAGCPLDLELATFPVGMCTRTLFMKADIVLWRTDQERFHLEVWRSFAPYVWELLSAVGREYR